MWKFTARELLPNGLAIKDVKNSTSMPRNMFLFTNANYYRSRNGVRCALEYAPSTVFFNGVEYKEITHIANGFVITIPRESNQAQAKSNQAGWGSNKPRMDLVVCKLTKKEKDIRNFCSVPRTA